MKKGYKRLLIFVIIIIIIFLLSNFVSSILSDYYKIIFILISTILFKLLFGFEKDRNLYTKSICLEIIICLLIYFLLYYLFGIIITFAKTNNFLTFNKILTVIIPLILTIVFKEILRYMMLKKSEGSKLLIVFSCLFFVCFDLIGTINLDIISSPYNIFIYIALTILPIISKNIFCSYLSYKNGYKPVILYLLIMNLYRYIIPIIPNPNQYLYSVIELIVPMIFLYRIYRFYKVEMDEEIVREYHKKSFSKLILPTIVIIILVYLTSGYFYFHAIVVASGSMTPNISKGDVVIIEKIKNKKDIKVGTVIAYKYDDIIIVHRLVKKINVDDGIYYYTKGDANDHFDNYKITEDMIIGVVNIDVPYIGYPTVWIKEL